MEAEETDAAGCAVAHGLRTLSYVQGALTGNVCWDRFQNAVLQHEGTLPDNTYALAHGQCTQQCYDS